MQKIIYNIYDANRSLPEPVWIFQLVRRIDHMMREDPNKYWCIIKEWARPMNQLTAGLFLNITGTTAEEIGHKINMDGPSSEDIKLEMSWIDCGYIRVCFYVQGQCSDK